MNCQRIQKLLPLYISRDLEDKGAQAVAVHVQSCNQCSNAAAEYRLSRQLLQELTPPQFGEDVYAGVRRRVLIEIGREVKSPIQSRIIPTLLGSRLGWAIATALLLVVALFAFYFVAVRKTEMRNVADKAQRADTFPSGNNEKSSTASAWNSYVPKAGEDPASPGTLKRQRQTQRDARPRMAPDSRAIVANNTSDRAPATEAISAVENLTEPNGLASPEPLVAAEPLRIEIQTQDPNIRIIWFYQQRPKQNLPQ